MAAPVDLTSLREMTDGDVAMEKELFLEFFSSFESGLKALQESCGEAAETTWRENSHALKGIALNLGAMQLGGLCKKAQDSQKAASDIKAAMLQEMQAEYALVKQFLSTML